jgi:hypothetical protein
MNFIKSLGRQYVPLNVPLSLLMASAAEGQLTGQWRRCDISIRHTKTDGSRKGKGIIGAIVDINIKTIG